LSAIATALAWRHGDSVVVADGEFPANVYAWWGLESHGVTTRVAAVENGRLTVDAVAAAIDATTRVVTVSAVDFATGQRRPLAAIGQLCRERNVLFCVDAIQALGAVTIDVGRDGIGCLAADGHKWLCAPEGCGVLYVGEQWIDQLRPQRLGWKSVNDPGRYVPYHFDLKRDAGKFEPGSLNFLGIHALGAAIDLALEIGPAVIERAVLDVTATLREAAGAAGYRLLSPAAADERAGITTIAGNEVPEVLVARLRSAGVLASARGGGVRLSPHFYTDASDIARCMAALRA
jgi:selenocysteine lyase/cysteine desulfurase